MLPLKAGDLLKLRSKIHEVLSCEEDLVTLCDVECSDQVEMPLAELWAGYTKRWVQFLNENAYSGVSSTTAFSLLPENERNEALRRRQYLLAIDDEADGGEIGNADVIRISESVARRLKELVPDHATLRRWCVRWIESDRDIMSLVPNWRKRGNRTSRLDGEIEDTIDQLIDREYLTLQRKSAAEVYELLRHEIMAINRDRPCDLRLRLPSKRALYRRIANLDSYHVAIKRHGREWADRHFKMVKRGGRRARWPNEVWEVDATPLDILVDNPEQAGSLAGRPGKRSARKKPLRRLWLTLVIDVYSRAIVGFHLSFLKPSYVSIAHALKMAITPKDQHVAKFSSIKGDWPCWGLPRVLVCDNGMENHAKAFSEMCAALGVELVYTARRNPQGKPHVERVLRTVNEYMHTLPGTTFSNPKDRGDYDSRKHARLAAAQVEEILTRFIVDIYLRRVHRSLAVPALHVWTEGAREFPIQPARSLIDLDLCYMITRQRVLQKDGIHFENHIYCAPELQEMWNPFSRDSVTFRYDPEDIGRILVIDGDRTFEAPCVDMPELVQGLSQAEHKRVWAARHRYGEELTDQQAVAQAHAENNQLVREAAKRGGGRRPSRTRSDQSASDRSAWASPAAPAAIASSSAPGEVSSLINGPSRVTETNDEDWLVGTNFDTLHPSASE